MIPEITLEMNALREREFGLADLSPRSFPLIIRGVELE